MESRHAELMTTVLIAFVLLAIVLFVAAAFLNRVQTRTGCILEQQACKESVLANARVHLPGVRAASIDCRTQMVEIGDSRISKNNGCSVQTFRKDEREERIKKAVADEMYYCWDQFLQGKENLFGDPTVYCSLCSVITFHETDAGVKGLSDFLVNERASGGEMSYYAFLSNGADARFSAEMERKFREEELSGQKLMVLFVYAKRDDMAKKALSYAYGTDATGALLGGFGDDAVVLFGTRVIPSPLIRKAGSAFMRIGGTPMLAATGGTLAGSIALKALFGPDTAEWASYVTVRSYDPDAFSSIGCQQIVSKLPKVQGNEAQSNA